MASYHAIYGPPGTGKTTRLLSIIDGMIKAGVPQSKIGFVSFTRAAAEEARSRVGLDRANNFSTLHSLCYRLSGVTKDSVIDFRRKKEFGELIGVPISGKMHDEDGLSEGDEFLQVIQMSHHLELSYDVTYEDHSSRPGSIETFMMFAQGYEQWKRANGIVDFDDMLHRVLAMRIKYNVIHLVVDEAQDLSKLQWRVIRELVRVADPKSVHIAGDDDQAIHEWAGADPHGMFKFEEEFGAEREVLSQSWRVPASVHVMAQGVINRVQTRVPKQYSPRTEPGFIKYYGDFALVDIDHGEDVLVLARTHSILEEAETHLRTRHTPYSKHGGRPSLLENRYAIAIRAWDKVRRGDDLEHFEYKALKGCVSPADARLMETGDFKFILTHRWEESLMLPPSFHSYYLDVPVDTVPTVRISTIHAAKGKEADRVVLITQMTGRVMAGNMDKGDSEARVWYVGVTRAKRRLDIVLDGDGYDLG